jgi:hypothetical protein
MIPIGILTAAATSSFSYLLDQFPSAAAAYSLRKLRSAYSGNCIRVRRSSDVVDQDFGFINNVLDLTALQTFIGVNTGYIITWYDQSGNGNNATNTVTLNCPIIILSGVLQTQGGKPTIYFNSATQNWLSFTQISSNTNLGMFLTQKSISPTITAGSIIGHDFAGGSGPFFGYTNTNTFNLNASLNGIDYNSAAGANSANTNYSILNCIVNSTDFFIYQNNTNIALTKNTWIPSTTFFTRIGRYFSIFYSNSYISEIVIYKIDQTSNRTGIVNNTNTFYTIF